MNHQLELKHINKYINSHTYMSSSFINNNISFHHFNYNNSYGDISPTTTPTPTMQRLQLCNDTNYKMQHALNSWMVKASQGIIPQQVNDKAFQGNKPPTGE